MPVLALDHLRKAFGELVAVEDVGFAVEAGEVFGLLGPNGAGKSTTVAMACGLLEPDRGTVEIDGERLTPANRALRKKLGVVPQELAIYPELTARQNLRFFGKLYGLRGTLLDERVADALDRTGLTNRADDRSDHYSGGMKRRLNFGCGLLHRPDLLILDEPTVGVDPQSRSHLLDSVRRLADEGMAVIYVSHYMEEVEEVCGRVAVIDAGRVLALDTLDALLGRMSSTLRLRVCAPQFTVPAPFRGVVEVVQAQTEACAGEGGECVLAIDRDKLDADTTLAGTLAALLAHLKDTGVRLESVQTSEPSLERLFLELTGNTLRD